MYTWLVRVFERKSEASNSVVSHEYFGIKICYEMIPKLAHMFVSREVFCKDLISISTVQGELSNLGLLMDVRPHTKVLNLKRSKRFKFRITRCHLP